MRRRALATARHAHHDRQIAAAGHMLDDRALLCRQMALRETKFGRRVLYARSDLNAWAAARRYESTSENYDERTTRRAGRH